MKAPLSLAKFYTNLDLLQDDVDGLAEAIGAQLGAVEEVIDFGAPFAGALVVHVNACESHPDSDHMHVCKIDDGGKVEGVERDAEGLVQVVCGAPNVRAGLRAVWLPPGTTVPESYGKDPFVLGTRELRGVKSNGMLASPRELGLGDSHEGILEIDEEIAPGTSFADAYNLHDYIIDIENKMFTHRPDCFGLLGVYRELAGIQQQKFVGPDWYGTEKYSLAIEAEALPLTVTNELPELVPRFMAIPMSNVTVGPSPLWLQIHLVRLGLRPINNIVDMTNYLMCLTGQPLHAYDYDKVAALTSGAGAEITVRYPRSDEKITLLSGKEIAPRSEAIMIASGDHLIGVGGVMGGASTEVSDETTRIIIEVATFDMYSIRRTSMAHGLFTDAVTRFNKGQSPLQNPYVLAKAVHETRTLAGGTVAGDAIDISQVEGRVWVHPPVPVSVGFINERLGFALSADDMRQLLENVECSVQVEGDQLTVTAPFWRTDIETREDVVEEIGRLYGFDKLPLELPKRSIMPVQKDEKLELKAMIRARLARAGANEVLAYSFVHGDLLKKAGQQVEEAFQVSNALSPDLQYYRVSLTPSLLDKVHMNIKAGYDRFALFEIGKAHGVSETEDDGLPREFGRISFVFAAEPKTAAREYGGAPYYQAQRFAGLLIDLPAVTIVPLAKADLQGHRMLMQMAAPFDLQRAAMLYSGERPLGIIGDYKRSVMKALKLPDFCAGFELFLSAMRPDTATYTPLSRFPKVSQDITLKIAADTPVGELDTVVRSMVAALSAEQYAVKTSVLDIYQEAGADYKNVTYRLDVTHYQRTLTDAEVTKILDSVANAAHGACAAERI
ncbi:MAG TPA: phenylalanine--tRNA ligase subunit beta [Candidatus Saccharimonadales bacterium]|nr:phenylalanine--tRNA ligase subunit beta [Candidatus Saccharimonadales bacterium]